MIIIKNCLEIITMTLGENKMNKFKKGDKVDIHDGSYCFGIKDGEYSDYCSNRDGSRKNLTVVTTGLSVVKLRGRNCSLCNPNHLSGEFTAVNDLLVTDNKGSFWFTQSRFCKPATHTITIDGKTIELSHKSYLALKGQFV